jgi:hypothetical protein
MDERLEKALEFSNYMVTLNNHKRILTEKFKEQTVYYFNGGQFTLSKDIITFVNMLVEKDNSKDIVLIDDNETPILVPDLEDFLSDIIDTYFRAANSYHTEYKELMNKRSIEKLAEYEEK